MNTGQRLVSLSGLPSGSALAHFMAIQLGSGTGSGETVFASRFSVVTGEERFELVRKAKRQPAPAAEVSKPAQLDSQRRKSAYAFTSQPSIVVSTSEDELTITHKSQSVVATLDLGSITVNRKDKK